jgi:pentatricopeptide repeat protein
VFLCNFKKTQVCKKPFYDVFERMLADNVKPNETTFLLAIESCIVRDVGFRKSTDFAKLKTVLQLMRSAGCAPNVQILTALAQAEALGGRWMKKSRFNFCFVCLFVCDPSFG